MSISALDNVGQMHPQKPDTVRGGIGARRVFFRPLGQAWTTSRLDMGKRFAALGSAMIIGLVVSDQSSRPPAIFYFCLRHVYAGHRSGDALLENNQLCSW